MRRLRLALPSMALVAALAAFAQQPDPPATKPVDRKVSAETPPLDDAQKAALELDKKLMAEAKAGTELMTNLTYLSDVIGPRLTGSANLKRANSWAADKMKSYGLSNVRLEPWTIPVGWERGTASMKLLEPNNGRTLTVAAAGWSPGTKGKVTGPVVVFNARSKDDLAKYKGKLKNAVILRGPPANVRPITDVSYGPPPGAGGGGGGGRRGGAEAKGDGPQGKGEPRAEGKVQPKADAPPAKGDAPPAKGEGPQGKGDGPQGKGGRFGDPAMFEQMQAFQNELREFLRTEGVAAMLSDSGKPHGLLNMTGNWPRNPDRAAAAAAEAVPTLFITHEGYALLYRLASRKDVPLPEVEVEITNTFVPGPVTVYNTVGEITGSEKPDEYVVLGAHIDSWDLGQGTTDNGTGTSVVLEAARLISKSGIKPRRTIRFCLFSGEEEGLHGSQAFVKAHKDDMAKTSLCIVHDTGTGRVQTVGTQGRPALKPIFDREFASLLSDLGVKEITNASQGGSDHGSFDSAGVPGIMFFQDMSEYRFTHHSQSDTLDKAKEADLVQGAQAMAIAGLRVANLDSLLPREKPARQGGGRRFGQ
ncbi:MAG: M20/M25/M40 family metallo-hydrolase [Gemmataceae bacterium]